jgi:hypothetical protein
LEEGQATKISSRKSRSFLRSSPALSSRSLSSKIPIQGVGPRLLEENNSHGYPNQNSFFENFSSFVGNVFSMGLQPFCLWFQASKASRLPLKGFGHQYGLL